MSRWDPMDYSGQRFGRLAVAGRASDKSADGRALWECICDCGAKKLLVGSNLKRTNSCGCYGSQVSRDLMKNIKRKRPVNITGRRFERLTVRAAVKNERGKTVWSCACDCGRQCTVAAGALTRGLQKSCGCLLREKARERAYDIPRRPKMSPDAAKESRAESYERSVGQLSDWYVRQLLTNNTDLTRERIPQYLVDIKREQLCLHRLARNLKQAIDDDRSKE